jgi:hypothetical protein
VRRFVDERIQFSANCAIPGSLARVFTFATRRAFTCPSTNK